MKNIFRKIKLQVIFFIARRVRNCQNITPLFTESLDRQLPWRTRIEMKLHLFTCSACVRYLKQIKFLRETMRREAKMVGENSSPPDKLSDDAKERIKNALRSNQETGS